MSPVSKEISDYMRELSRKAAKVRVSKFERDPEFAKEMSAKAVAARQKKRREAKKLVEATDE